jgi:hypothetical protein
MSGQVHDRYGKKLMKAIAGATFVDSGNSVRVQYAGQVSAIIDGVLEGYCAIEIESRVSKQVRGALIDLLSHPLPNKLLILIPAHAYNPLGTAEHCAEILNRYRKPDERVEVVLLTGTGHNPRPLEDKALIKQALKRLGCPIGQKWTSTDSFGQERTDHPKP